MAKKKSVSKAGASAPAVKQGAPEGAPDLEKIITPVETQEDAPVVETASDEVVEITEVVSAEPVTEEPVKKTQASFTGRYTIKNMTRMPLALPVGKTEIKAYGSGEVDIRDADHFKEIRRELDTLAELNGFKNDVFIVAPVAAQ